MLPAAVGMAAEAVDKVFSVYFDVCMIKTYHWRQRWLY